MKSISLITLLCLYNFAFAQSNSFPKNNDGKVEYSEVINIPEKNAEELYTSGIEFFSTNLKNFQRGNSEKNYQGMAAFGNSSKQSSEDLDALYKNEKPVSYSDKENKKIIGRIVNKYTGGTMGCIRVLYLEYDVVLKFKDNRYRYEISNFNFTHYNQVTLKQSQMWGFKDSGFCNSKNTLENMLNCEKCKKEYQTLYQYIDLDTKTFINSMNSFIKNAAKDDNW